MVQTNKKITIAALIVFITGTVCFGGIFIRDTWVEHKAAKLMEDMKQNTSVMNAGDMYIQDDDAAEVELPLAYVNFEELWKTNKDIYAWLCVPGTGIDYPVLQHPSDSEYYLKYNLDGSRGYPGCVYSECEVNGKDFSDYNTVLYAHNMRNGTMFAELHKFADRSFFDANRHIYVYVPDGVLIYDIFAAYRYGNVHLLKEIDISTKDKFQNYINDIMKISGANISEDVSVNANDYILTLETCTNSDSVRYIVQAVLTKKLYITANQ